MKKLFAVILTIFLSSIFAFSQTETPKSADWQTFAPESEEFSIEVPISLKASIFPNIDPKNVSRRYLNSLDGTYFCIFSDDPKKTLQFEFVAAFANLYKKGETAKSFEGFETQKFEFTDNEDFFHTILFVKGKSRFYVFQTISPNKENLVVARFFNGIKFGAKTSAENMAESKAEKDITIDVPTSNTENKQVEANNGTGRGQGNGTGNGQGNQTKPETKPSIPQTPVKNPTPLKLLSKPKANYTDFARFYEIAGKVSLRVTFMANGTIGTVSVVSKLPFGLTEQAIIAARGIRFEPAMKEGVAVSVTKMIEYNFTIY